MPTYEYACINCDKTVEITRSIHEPSDTQQCPDCGYNLVRVFSAPGIQFKGSGFYSTGN